MDSNACIAAFVISKVSAVGVRNVQVAELPYCGKSSRMVFEPKKVTLLAADWKKRSMPTHSNGGKGTENRLKKPQKRQKKRSKSVQNGEKQSKKRSKPTHDDKGNWKLPRK